MRKRWRRAARFGLVRRRRGADACDRGSRDRDHGGYDGTADSHELVDGNPRCPCGNGRRGQPRRSTASKLVEGYDDGLIAGSPAAAASPTRSAGSWSTSTRSTSQAVIVKGGDAANIYYYDGRQRRLGRRASRRRSTTADSARRSATSSSASTRRTRRSPTLTVDEDGQRHVGDPGTAGRRQAGEGRGRGRRDVRRQRVAQPARTAGAVVHVEGRRHAHAGRRPYAVDRHDHGRRTRATSRSPASTSPTRSRARSSTAAARRSTGLTVPANEHVCTCSYTRRTVAARWRTTLRPRPGARTTRRRRVTIQWAAPTRGR